MSGCAPAARWLGLVILFASSPASGSVSWVPLIPVLPTSQMRLVPNPAAHYNLDGVRELVRVNNGDVDIGGQSFLRYSEAFFSSRVPIEHVQVVRQLTLSNEWSANRYVVYTNSVDNAGYIGIVRIPRGLTGTVDRDDTQLVLGMTVGDGNRDDWGQAACYPDHAGGCLVGSGETVQGEGSRGDPTVPIQHHICVDSARCADTPAANVNHPAAVSQMGPYVVVQCQDGGVSRLFQASNHNGGYCFLDVRNPESPKWLGMLLEGSDGGAKAAAMGYSRGFVYLIVGNRVWRFFKRYASPYDFSNNFRYDFNNWVVPPDPQSDWVQLGGCVSFSVGYTWAEAHSQNYSIQLDTLWRSWFINERQGTDSDTNSDTAGIVVGRMVFYDSASDTYADHMEETTDCVLLESATLEHHPLSPTSHHCGRFVNVGSNWDPASNGVELICADEGSRGMELSIIR